MIADPGRRGSLMRFHLDTRFSRDKSRYKRGGAAHLPDARGKDGAKPAYYLHLEPGRSMVGAGIWRPEPGALRKVRDAIVADGKRWRRVISAAAFRAVCGMGGESLKRSPADYDPKHPLIEDIKRKDFVTSFLWIIRKSAGRSS